MMTDSDLVMHIEALVFASDKPLTAMEITELVNNANETPGEKIKMNRVETAIETIVKKYNDGNFPFEIKMNGGGWQFLTRKEFHGTVAQLNGDKYLKRLSSASLETLAIIAYKQPITKGEIESIRGVNCDYSVQKLLEKELVIISGRNEKQPGQPLLYSTSKSFMDYFGINSPEELPEIREVMAEQTEPTNMKNTLFGPDAGKAVKDDENALSVTEGGELIINKDPEEAD
ncbi:MAG TPA: SMC-Scp complex subunit ScpB [Chitinophagaceae bacterium]|nr:SMC-Scp complex subunit ScpB [Chitinophagaceae bacterium]